MSDSHDIVHGDVRKQFLDIETKLKRHRESIKNSVPIIFCVRCGATFVDQNFPTELRCYECGTTMPWNSKKFSIRRGLDAAHDVISAFNELEKLK